MTPQDRDVQALEEKIQTRLDAMDKAIDLLQKFTDRQPTTASVAQSVAALEALMEEKFLGVANQFMSSHAAVDSAFAAAKEAISKSEASFTKQIDQLTTLVNTKDRQR
jgi:hypothetical protein